MASVLLAGASALHAQGATVTGTVQDPAGVPLSGAQVQVLGTGLGTIADERGRFLIANVPAGPQRLRASLIGYRAEERDVAVGTGTNQVAFELRYSPLALDEVVVTGQGAAISRRRLSTSVQVISPEEIQASPATRLDQLLQESLPAVQVRLSSGQPGSTSVMRGRGPVSVSRSTTPVIYVDGVRVDNLNSMAELSLNTSGNRRQGTQTSSIADIPLENIERIEYIPGGAATTLYGSDAANGVIQIFTNKGAAGRSQFSYQSEIGVETMDDSYFYFPQTADLLYRKGLTQQHRLSGSGGSETVTFSLSGSVQDRAGFRVDNNASRNYQARTGLAAHISDDLRYEASFSFGWNNYERSRDGNAGGYTPLWLLEGGRIGALGFNNRLNEATAEEMSSLREFVDRAEALQNYRIQVARFQTSQALKWQVADDLSFRTVVGVDYRNSNERGIETNEFLIHTRARPAGTDDRGSISSYDRRFLGLTLEGAGQHEAAFGDFSVVTSAGAQLFRNDDAQASRVALNVRDGSETVRGAGSTEADDFFLQVVNYGGYAQQNWGFLDRYFLEAGIRADGNSAFGGDVGVQYYPKVGIAYDLGSEPFFQNLISPSWISSLRLRGNYGVAGNFPPAFARDRTIVFASYLGRQSAAFGQPGNLDLGPEKTATFEVGGEMEAFDGRMTVELTGYDARTRGALFLVPSAPSSGQAAQFRNVGEIQNNGVELRISGDVIRTQNLNVNFSGALNTLNNKVVDAGGSPTFDLSGFSSSTITSVVEEGFPVGFLRGNKAVFDESGAVVGAEALSYLGSPLPDRFGSLGMDVTVRNNLRLTAAADWQTGAQMHSFNRQFRYLYGLDDPALSQVVLGQNRPANWLRLTNQFVEDTDYLKVRAISASYTLPANAFGSRFSGVELGLAVQNPIGWWSSSFDPESDHSGAASQGGATVGGFNYASDPSPRTFLGSVRFRF